ncbi:MAG TPA: ribosome-associated translation inhibitor RaiA [Vicinamibacteria bacterium]|nr:ribosome-associated translation inhibitor RaiA [Vicinamibacteria bacterium]
MQIEYTGRQTEVTPRLRALAEKRLRKLARVLRTITHAHVIFTSDKHRRIAEVSVHSPHLVLTAQEETAEMAASLGNVLDKLERQAQRQVGKRQDRKRRSPARGAGPAPRVIRSRRSPRAMTVQEAIAEVEGSRDGLVVYRDTDTERMAVLFKRKDGNLGLIEPEA